LFYRPYWRCYYSNTDAVVYVIDSVDRERMGIAKDELMYMLKVSYILKLITSWFDISAVYIISMNL